LKKSPKVSIIYSRAKSSHLLLNSDIIAKFEDVSTPPFDL